MKECSRCRICFDDTAEFCPLDGAPLYTAFEGEPIIDGKYGVEKCLGRGGMGVVYRVRHVSLQRQFALKLIRTSYLGSKSFLEHFQMEARTLGRLKHPNIVDVTDYGVDSRAGGLPYLVMEYLEGRRLSEVCHSEGALSPSRALPIFEAIANAIDYAHDHGVLHRDLKPANVLIIRREKDVELAKILDFGLARLIAGAETKGQAKSKMPENHTIVRNPDKSKLDHAAEVSLEGVTLTVLQGAGPLRDASRESIEGTLAYLAPELFEGALPTRSADIYAFGVLIYETLVGKLPFSGTSFELLRSHLKTSPPVPSRVQPTVPAELDPAILSALAKEPAQRPPRAKNLVTALRNAWLVAQRRKWRGAEIPRRLCAAALLGVACALACWPLLRVEFVESVELRTTDLRYAASPPRSPDSRLLIVAVDESSLAADPSPLAERADQFGSTFERVFSAGARGVAIDFVLPEQWARSEIFSRFLLGHPENVTLAVISSPSGEIVGTKCVNPLTTAVLGPARFAQLFGLANLSEDGDGVTRKTQLFFRDTEGKLRDSWAAHAVKSLTDATSGTGRRRNPEQPVWIDYSANWRGFPKISWKDVPAQLDRDASLFRGRLVLVGGDLIGSGDDYHRIPARSEQFEVVSGLALQSLLVNTILAGFPVEQAGYMHVLPLVAMGYAAILAAALCISRLYSSIVVIFIFFIAYGGIAVLSFHFWGLLIPVAGPLLIAVLALGLGLVIRFYLTPFPVSRSEEA